MNYTEFPTDRIIDVRFKKKPDDRPPSPCQPGSELCNTYSMGATVGLVSASVISAIMGPMCVAPFVGTFSTVAGNGPKGKYGNLNHPPSASIPTTMTAAAFGLIAIGLLLEVSDFQFTTQQLMGLADGTGHTGTYGWIVPMADGAVLFDPSDKFSPCIPILVDTYTIDMEWEGAFSDHTFGLAIQHPIPGFVGTITPPTSPLVVLGGSSGSASYSYAWRWKEYALNEFTITEANQYSDTVGGPALLWWMTSRDGGRTWGAHSDFMSTTLADIGSGYSWTLSCTCIPEPNLFGR